MGIRQRLKLYSRQFRDVIRDTLDPYYWRLAQEEYAETLAKVSTFEEATTQMERYKGHGHYYKVTAFQDPIELRSFVQRVVDLDPQVVVEIGTAAGGTLFQWCRNLPSLRLLVSIDLPGGFYGGGYPLKRAKLYNLFVSDRPHVKLELIRASSQLDETKQRLLDVLDGQQIDFLYIDGDHRYEGVKLDYELYAPLVRPGGLIAFHDICPNPLDLGVKVYQLWDEVRSSGAKTSEIVQDPNRSELGIGLLTKE